MDQEPQSNVHTSREERDFNLREFIVRYSRYWYLFAIALALSFAAARYYNWYQNPVFAVAAKLQVRDDNQSREGLLKALDVEMASKNIENEIEVIRSFNLLAKTLNELEFDVSYFLIGDVKVSEVYKDCPFRISATHLNFEAYTLPIHIFIKDPSSYKLSFSQNGEQKGYEGHFGDTIHTSLGNFIVDQRDNFPFEALADKSFEKRNYKVHFNTMGYNQNRYVSRLNVGLSRPQSTILQVYLEDEVPQKALDFVNKLIEVYLNNDIDQKNKAAAATRIFLDDQLASITEDLESIEINRERYKVDKGIIDLQSESQMVLESIREMDQQRSINNARIGMIDLLERYVVDNADLRDLAPAALDINDPLLIRLINKLSELQGERQQILNKSTVNDPKLNPLNAEIDLTRSSLLENIRNIRKSLTRKDTELNEDIRTMRSRMQRIPTTERELLEIERRFRIQEGLYTFLLQRRAELSISLAAAESNTRLVDSARLLPGPIRPVKQKAYGVAMLLGLMIPLLIIFLIDKLQDKVIDLSTLKRLSSAPLLGIVQLSKHEGSLVTVDKPRSPIAEEYRSLRANLQFFIGTQNPQVIMVTSSVGTEGKTFNAMNLACVLASTGSKVVLVGLDLRKPRIVEDFGLSNKTGCSNYLSGTATLDEVLQSSGVLDNLSIISAGPIPPNPSELILSQHMTTLIDNLKQRFDKVVLDTPPIGLVSDGLVIADHAQLTLFIIRYAVTRKDHVKHMEDLYIKGQLGQVALIFNAVKYKRGSYGYAYSYGSGYGYGSSYGAYFDEDDNIGRSARLNSGRKK